MAGKIHWDQIYINQPANQVGWFQTDPKLSRQLIEASKMGTQSRIIDVGCGASRLLGGLLDMGYNQLTGLDISSQALRIAQKQLGERASQVTWIEGDITQVELPVGVYDIWHDRAVFHFFTQLKTRQKYVKALRQALSQGGVVILAVFALDGPEHCSGLDVRRYDAAGLLAELGSGFVLEQEKGETHITPGGGKQAYLFARFRRSGG